MEEFETRLINLPYRVRGLTTVDENGDPMIYLNARLTIEQHKKTYDHEVEHIVNDDLHNAKPIEEVERLAKESTAPPKKDFTKDWELIFKRGLDLYGFERKDKMWDAILHLWFWRDHRDKYDQIMDDTYLGYTRRQLASMVKNIFKGYGQKK